MLRKGNESSLQSGTETIQHSSKEDSSAEMLLESGLPDRVVSVDDQELTYFDLRFQGSPLPHCCAAGCLLALITL